MFEDFIGETDLITKVKEMITKIANTELTVLVRGKTGTGKEIVARVIHNMSSRQNKPFVKVNCATLPEALLESELFGYERGAFTGAQLRKVGRFETADKGTIFLDEIGEMSPSLQVKLLQVLEEKEFYRLGGRTPIRVDVRIIVATNRNLEEEIRNNTFRDDLFYRLNEISVTLPSLKERKDDIPLLVEYFTNKHRNGSNINLSKNLIERFMSYNWPGNVRELENFIKRFIILGSKDGTFNGINFKDPEESKVPIQDQEGVESNKEKELLKLIQGINFWLKNIIDLERRVSKLEKILSRYVSSYKRSKKERDRRIKYPGPEIIANLLIKYPVVTRAAKEGGFPYRTLYYWRERYWIEIKEAMDRISKSQKSISV